MPTQQLRIDTAIASAIGQLTDLPSLFGLSRNMEQETPAIEIDSRKHVDTQRDLQIWNPSGHSLVSSSN